MDEQRIYNSLERLNDKIDGHGDRLIRIEVSMDGLSRDLSGHKADHDKAEQARISWYRDWKDTSFKVLAAVGGLSGIAGAVAWILGGQ